MLDPKDYSFTLPDDLIAHIPAAKRDQSKLLTLEKRTGKIAHTFFHNLPQLLTSDQVLVLNNTKVFPARLKGYSKHRQVEILLLKKLSNNSWRAMSHPGLKVNTTIEFQHSLKATVTHRDNQSGHITLKFHCTQDELTQHINKYGRTPIPPYIKKQLSESKLRQLYQTTYAANEGSAAAPTAGLHFTKELLSTLESRGVGIEYLTLHVGPGTFQRVWDTHLTTDTLHQEEFYISPSTVKRIKNHKHAGKKIVAVGTTTTRALESAVQCERSDLSLEVGPLNMNSGWQSTRMFIHPPFRFQVVDSLITNFHLPESSLLMLISAFTTSPNTTYSFTTFKQSSLGKAYQEAIDHHYRFYSFGDAMIIH